MKIGTRLEAPGNHKGLGVIVCAVLFAFCSLAQAQPSKKIPRIGYVDAGSTTTTGHRAKAFVQGLRDRGYVERENILIEYRWAEGKSEILSTLVKDVVRLKVDVIVSSATPAIQFAKEQTTNIPIVMDGVTDPVGNGFVASLARAGKNVTRLTHVAPDLTGKRLELLKEVLPGLSRRIVESESIGSVSRFQRYAVSDRSFEVDSNLHGSAKRGRLRRSFPC